MDQWIKSGTEKFVPSDLQDAVNTINLPHLVVPGLLRRIGQEPGACVQDTPVAGRVTRRWPALAFCQNFALPLVMGGDCCPSDSPPAPEDCACGPQLRTLSPPAKEELEGRMDGHCCSWHKELLVAGHSVD